MLPHDMATVPRQALHNTFFCCTSVDSKPKYSHTTKVPLFFSTKLSTVASGSADGIFPYEDISFLGFSLPKML